MNPELLEPLLRDRALGELSPAVSALLDAHLAQHPAAARRAAALADAIRLARTAVATPLAAPRRPLDLARLRGSPAAASTVLRRLELLPLAACLAVGLGLGWWLRTARLAAPAATPVAVALAVMPRPAEPPMHFWSLARLAAESTPADNRRPLPWGSSRSPTKDHL